MGKVYVKATRHGSHVLVAICDAELLGKTIKGNDITIKVNESFYKGSLMEAEEAVELIRNASIVNLLGRDIIGEAIKRKLVIPEAVMYISDVPHVQIIWV